MADLTRHWTELRKMLDARAWFTFTPTFTNAEIASSACRYTRIGDMYYVHWDVTIVAVPTFSSTIVTSTLPESISLDMPTGIAVGWGHAIVPTYNLVILTSTSAGNTVNFVRYNVANANLANVQYRVQAILPKS